MISLWRGRRVLFAGLVAASLGLAGLAATVAYCVQVGVDALVRGKPLPGQALALGAVFLGMAGLGVVLEIFRTRAAERIGLGYVAQLRAALFERVLRASPELLAQRGQGGLLLPFVGDLTAIKKWVSDGLVRLISAVVSSVLLLGVLTGKSPLLGLAAGAVLLCAMLAVLALAAPLNSAIRETRHRRGAIAAFVSRSIRGAGTIRAFHRFDRERKRLARRNAALMTAGLRLAGISGAMTATVPWPSAVISTMRARLAIFWRVFPSATISRSAARPRCGRIWPIARPAPPCAPGRPRWTAANRPNEGTPK